MRFEFVVVILLSQICGSGGVVVILRLFQLCQALNDWEDKHNWLLPGLFWAIQVPAPPVGFRRSAYLASSEQSIGMVDFFCRRERPLVLALT